MALGGAAYYYNFLKWEKADLNEEEQNRALSLEESSMQTGSKNLEHLHENPRIKIRNIVAKFIDPHDKQHTSVYIEDAKKVMPELDPIKDKNLVEMLEMLTEGDDIMNSRFPLAHPMFWLEAYSKKDSFTKRLVNLLNSDPHKTKTYKAEDIDFEVIFGQKYNYPKIAKEKN